MINIEFHQKPELINGTFRHQVNHNFLLVCSVFLGNIKQAFDKNPSLSNLLVDSFFKEEIAKCQVWCFLSLRTIKM